jgi:hypothetical protein
MTTRLPPELIFHVISFLHNDKVALLTCSLCCSALGTITRPLLFHTLRTSLGSTAAAQFEDILESDPTVSPFIKRIDVAIPTFEAALNQRAIAAISEIIVRRWKQDTPPKLNLAVRPARSSFPEFEQHILPCLGAVLRWVTSLELDQLSLTGGVEFWRIILAFPRLTSLILGCITIGTARVHIPSHWASKVPRLTLKKFALDDSCNVRWLLADHPLPLPSLKSLDVRFPTALVPAHVRFAEHYGATVRSLRFGVVIVRSPTLDWDKFACKLFVNRLACYTTLILPIQATAEFISRFENLKALTFQGLLVPPVPIQRSPVTFDWIPVALRGVSPTVRKLTMEVVAAHLSYLDIIPWSAIDQGLACQLQSVTIVEILLATPIGMARLLDDVHQEMEKRLPLAAQRGVLRCSAIVEHPV